MAELTPPPPARSRQRGAALLLAMIIVALIATLATAMVWQQWRAVQVEAADRARAQSAWILLGAGDWARLILANHSGPTDNLGEPWALPLQEARLSTFLAADKDNTDDAPDAFLSGVIVDAQSRYNLTNLSFPATPADIAAENAVFVNLLDNIGVNGSEVGPLISRAVRAAYPPTVDAAASAASGATGQTTGGTTSPTGTSGSTSSGSTGSTQTVSSPSTYLQPHTVDQLAWFGVDQDTIERLRPYLIILPQAAGKTLVNINTAPKEVLEAVAGNVGLSAAQQWVQKRQGTPFTNVGDAAKMAGLGTTQTAALQARVGINSAFFEVRGRLRLGDKVLEQTSVVRRVGNAVTTIMRQRESLRDLPG